MLRVKICGITRAQDAHLAADLGADAIGLVFYDKSPRYVTVEKARSIVSGLPPWLMRVGVFVDAAPDEVARTAAHVGLTAIQLHGRETPEYISKLEVNLPVIKAVYMGAGWKERVAAYGKLPILLDAADAQAPGGSGRVWAWDQFDQVARPHYLVLAGGLTPDNVRSAVQAIDPDGIDVSSGVERSPGIKDAEKMTRFFNAVREFRKRPRPDTNA
jgi:phosphoribosylanthranilate isomerase